MNTFNQQPTAPRVELRIGELVLNGFAPGDRYHIWAALERELARLFAEQGVPDWLKQGGLIDRLDGGSFDLPPGPSAEVIGGRIAQAVYGRANS